MKGAATAGGSALRIGYAAALAVSALCVFTVLWSLIPGAFSTAALLLTVPMAPGSFTLVAAAAMAAYGFDAPPWFKWVAIAGAVWTAFITWSFLNL